MGPILITGHQIHHQDNLTHLTKRAAARTVPGQAGKHQAAYESFQARIWPRNPSTDSCRSGRSPGALRSDPATATSRGLFRQQESTWSISSGSASSASVLSWLAVEPTTSSRG